MSIVQRFLCNNKRFEHSQLIIFDEIGKMFGLVATDVIFPEKYSMEISNGNFQEISGNIHFFMEISGKIKITNLAFFA